MIDSLSIGLRIQTLGDATVCRLLFYGVREFIPAFIALAGEVRNAEVQSRRQGKRE